MEPTRKDGTGGLLRLYALRALLILAVGAGAACLGYVFGRAQAYKNPPAAAASVPRDGSREAMAKRNVVWRVWNGEAESLADTPERTVGAMLGLLLDPESPVEARNAGMRMYLQKSVAYFSAEEVTLFSRTMGEGSPQQRAAAFRRIAAADGAATALIAQVLADTERVNLYLAGSPVPLETLPDGSTP